MIGCGSRTSHQSLLRFSSCPTNSNAAADRRTTSPSKHQTKPIHPRSPDGLRPQAQHTSNADNNVKFTRAGFQKSNNRHHPQESTQDTHKKPESSNATQITSTIAQFEGNQRNRPRHLPPVTWTHISHTCNLLRNRVDWRQKEVVPTNNLFFSNLLTLLHIHKSTDPPNDIHLTTRGTLLSMGTRHPIP
jgi:hypothetical protein